MTDPDDRTAEPAAPDAAKGRDAERDVDGGAPGHDPAPDPEREVEDDGDERISDPGGDSDPQPSEP